LELSELFHCSNCIVDRVNGRVHFTSSVLLVLAMMYVAKLDRDDLTPWEWMQNPQETH